MLKRVIAEAKRAFGLQNPGRNMAVFTEIESAGGD
jgi:hypothetical protein